VPGARRQFDGTGRTTGLSTSKGSVGVMQMSASAPWICCSANCIGE
jgi:hypothetical protein